MIEGQQYQQKTMIKLSQMIYIEMITLGKQKNKQKRQRLMKVIGQHISQMNMLKNYEQREQLQEKQIQFGQLSKLAIEKLQYKQRIKQDLKKQLDEINLKCQQINKQMNKLGDIQDRIYQLEQIIPKQMQRKKVYKGICEYLKASQKKYKSQEAALELYIKDRQKLKKTKSSELKKIKQNVNNIQQKIQQQNSQIKKYQAQKSQRQIQLIESEQQNLCKITSTLKENRINNFDDNPLSRTSLSDSVTSSSQNKHISFAKQMKNKKQIIAIQKKQSNKKWVMKYGPWIALEVLVGALIYFG